MADGVHPLAVWVSPRFDMFHLASGVLVRPLRGACVPRTQAGPDHRPAGRIREDGMGVMVAETVEQIVGLAC